MDQAPLETRHSHDYNLQRLTVLTDAVFAIAMTLLALELRPPEHWNGSLVGLVTAMWRSLAAYSVSFFLVAAYWTSHRRSFHSILRTDGILTFLALLTLALVTLLPVITRLMIEQSTRSGALVIYMGFFAAIGVTNALLWGYACVRPGLVDPAATPRFRLVQFLLHLVPPLICCAVILLGSPGDSVWRWLVILALFVAVFAFRRWARRPDKPMTPETHPAPAPPASPVDGHPDDRLKHPTVGA